MITINRLYIQKITLLIFFLLLNTLLYAVTDNLYKKYVIGHWSGGMAVCITSALNHLSFCERHNLMPVVHWNYTYYHNPEGFNGKTKEWEYYFEPVSPLEYAPGDVVHHFLESNNNANFNYHDVTHEKRILACELIKKYIHLNSIVQQKVYNFYHLYMRDKKNIGIHLRGTDKYTEEKQVPPEVAIKIALEQADENTQFFIASDDWKLFDAMFDLLKGRKIIYYDCYRSNDGKPLHVCRKIEKKPSQGQLGEDVIVEMWLMSKCDLLVHSLSNVSSIPLYINPDLKHIELR